MSSSLSSDDSSDEINEISYEITRNQMEALIPMPHIEEDLSKYFTLAGIITLTVAPFTQGLFAGLGDALAKLYIGHYWLGMEPYLALGGPRFKRQRVARASSWFSWNKS